ncbi:hypothetical protein [Paenibacillus gansuensis]|uniref:Uncharacterized protein n=1 Tax=Paenibacillus gansuensis TaxID=306542 RepID=A0ABW5PAP1_9BACL
MDKRKVITAYRRGFITMQECAQILGLDSVQIRGLIEDTQPVGHDSRTGKQPVNS